MRFVGRTPPDAVAVQQHLDHHPWMLLWPASALPLVAGGDLRQIQLVHDVGDEVTQMVVRQPLPQCRWQQQLLVWIIGTLGLAHKRLPATGPAPIIPPTTRLPRFSDGLLVLLLAVDVAAEQPERAYRPVPAELSLTETISLKHTRKVARDNTVRFQWRVLQLLPGMDRPSYASLQVEVLERADAPADDQLSRRDRRFSGIAPALSSLWGATNPRSLGSQLQSISDDPGNGHLNHAQRTLLDSLQPTDEGRVSAKRVVTKAGRGAVKPIRHSLHRTPTQAQQARWEAVQKAKRQGLLPARYRRELGMSRVPPQSTHRRRVPHQTPKRQRACQGRGPDHIIDRRGLTTMTFSLFT